MIPGEILIWQLIIHSWQLSAKQLNSPTAQLAQSVWHTAVWKGWHWFFFAFFFFLCGLRSYQVLSSTTRWVKMRTGSQSLSKLPYFFPLLFFLHAFADMLQPLLQHVKAWPRRRIQIPALLHDVVHHFRTAVRTVHLVSLLHSRHKVFQWLKKRKRDPNQVSPSSTPLCTTQLLRLSLFIMIKNTRRKRYVLF